MHKWAKQIMECVKANVESIGIDNFSGQDLDDLKDWTEIAKNIVCFDKDYLIVEAMKEAENEDNIHMIELYEDYPGRRYYDDYRYMRTGRYAPKGKGTYVGRKGYEEPPYWHIMPEYMMSVDDYKDHSPEYWRDIDRKSGRMYYTEPATDRRRELPMNETQESRYDKAKRMYTETKDMHKANTPEDKAAKMKDLENYMKSIAEDLSEVIEGVTPEERSMVKNKLSVLVQKMS